MTAAGADLLERRVADLYATDEQFALLRPKPEITAAIDEPGTPLARILETVFACYADRPALAQRSFEYVEDPATDRIRLRHGSGFETISYAEAWRRITGLVAALSSGPGDTVQRGDRVCVLGFTSADYVTVDLALIRLGAVAVPLQTRAPLRQLTEIVEETAPVVFAASVDQLKDAVEVILASEHRPSRLIVFDRHSAVDDHREALEDAGERLGPLGVDVEDLIDLVERPHGAQPATADDDRTSTALLIYTSGSTGSPKGVVFRAERVARLWKASNTPWPGRAAEPRISLNFMPMSHIAGRETVYETLSNGGTAYFAATSDLSTFLEDLALTRPTRLNLVPRVWEMLHQHFQDEVHRRLRPDADEDAVESAVLDEMRESLLGGRYVSASTDSAPIAPWLRAWVERLLGFPLVESYGATECGLVTIDSQVRRPPVTDYRLRDVPELGYFSTDRPFPRGELLVKSDTMFPGYYGRPDVTASVFDDEGFYCTGDVMAETAPGRLEYVDRRNNVIKLSQGEFVAVSALEGAFAGSPLISQVYLHGSSEQAYLLAVVVPAEEALERAGSDDAALKGAINAALQDVARTAGLQPYEVPRDVLVERTPFTPENGLLTGVGKPARARLRERYGPVLDRLYADRAAGQAAALRALRLGDADGPVLDTVRRAAASLLGLAIEDLPPGARFRDLGGDSLSALTFAGLLRDILEVDVPVDLIVSPASSLETLSRFIETTRAGGGTMRPTFASVHGAETATARAGDLTLDKFLDLEALAEAGELREPDPEVRTVLLTGATGFLGRFLALEWLARMHAVGGRVICLVRGEDDAQARRRLDDVFDSGDLALLERYRALAAEHLEVIAGDKSQPDLGLDAATWRRLAETVDRIVDPAALVNHVLPYEQLFGPNVVGTAELIRLALTHKLKPYDYVSTLAIGDQVEPPAFTEDADVRQMSASREVDASRTGDSYANGYANSKWAGEVLAREAHDRFGLPVAVFRCGMILADETYAGQLNVPDEFTRLVLSLVATGLAPRSFYELGADGTRQPAHYDGLPVGFVAGAIAAIGAQARAGFQTYHVSNPHDDGIGLDTYVDWLAEAGHPVERVADYQEWLDRFEKAMAGLPEVQREASLLPLLHQYQRPAEAVRGPVAPADQFSAAVRAVTSDGTGDIPHVTPSTIRKYVADLQLVGLL